MSENLEITKKKTSRQGRWKYRLIFGLGFLLIIGCQADNIAKHLLLHPSKLPPNWRPQNVECENAFFETADGSRLHGLYFPCTDSKGTILYSHGNGGTVAQWMFEGIDIRDHLNVSILVYDYRGYGLSEGSPTASGILEDGRAARKWLADRENIAETDIIQHGRSLGGAVAIDLASNDGARALIIESTFASLPAMAGKYVPGIPARFLLREQLDSAKKIKQYTSPLYHSHGTADSLIPFSQGEKIFAAAASTDKTFYPIQGGDHNDPQPDDYYAKLKEYIDALPPTQKR